MSVLESVRRTIERHRLANPATRVVVALSGGPDSTALLHLLRELAVNKALVLTGVAHFNHQLRPESDADERACERQAASLGLPFVSSHGDVQRVALETGRSIEDAGHHLRTSFYSEAAQRLGADVVAVGHTRDDQAETFLLRLIRGAGSRGLAAMHPRSGVVIQPLLECSRDAVRAFLEHHTHSFLHDSTNDDVRIPRNRVRAELLPLLADRFNPRAVDALARAAELAQADEAYLASVATT